jgi:molybdate transport system substrate-binding protein
MPTVRPRACALIIAALAALIAPGCGGDDSTGTTAAGSGEFVKTAPIGIWAPTPLDPPFNAYALDAHLNTFMSFSGSNAAANQLRSDTGPPDLFVADSDAILQDLRDEGLVGEAVPLASDELVVAVPKESAIETLDDLGADAVTVAIGQEGLPLGDYAREALDALPGSEADAILANADSEDTNNNGIIEKVTKGKVDAGFLYATDVQANAGKLTAIELPPDASPEVVYTAAIVEGAENAPGAEHFLDAMLDGAGAKELEKAGFGPPPG